MRIATVLAVAFLGTTSLAGTEHAQAATRHYQLDIPRQSLDTALKDLAQQTGLQIGRFSDRIDGSAMVGPVKGDQTPEQALKTLLDNTGLNYKIVNDTTIAVYNPKDSTFSRPGISGTGSPLQVPEEGQGVRGKKGENSAGDRLQLAQAPQGSNSSAPSVDSSSSSQRDRRGGQRREDYSSSAEESGIKLDEIVVTARKREERLLDVPVAVTAFSGEALEHQGVASLSDVLQEAPGVNIYDVGARGYSLSIRGVSTSLGSNTTGYYLDELPFTGVTEPISPDVRAWDIKRIEVLRGPQGTLFGEGSMGGTVRILTNDPVFNEWQAQGLVTGSGTSGGGPNQGYKAMLNVPLVDDRLALRLAGTREKYGGWIDDSITGARGINTEDITTYRAKLRFQPIDSLTVGVGYWHFDGDYPHANTADDRGLAGTGIALGARTVYHLFGATVDYDFGPARAFYSYADNSFDLPQSGLLMGGTLGITTNIDVKSHELRFTSTGQGPWAWTVGAYRRAADRLDVSTFQLFGINNQSATDATSEALFGEGTYSLARLPLDLTLGLRTVRERLDDIETNSGVSTAPLGRTYRSTNPRVIVAWRASADWRLYTSAAKGYRSGQIQPSVALALAGPLGIALPATLRDDSIWTYEIGTKASLADGRAIVEAAVYHSKWENATVRIPIATTGLNGLINSSGTNTNGIEASLAVQIWRDWRLNLAASYADATYAGDVPGTGIHDGTPVDDFGKTTASASVDYGHVIFNTLRGSARVGVQYNSARDLPSFGPPLYLPGDAITTLTARFGIEALQWGVFLYGDNLTDDEGAVSARSVTIPGVTPAIANRLRPRTVGLEVQYRFGQPE